MEHYIGLDVSLKETSICVVDGDGKIVCEGTVISQPVAIAEFVRAKAISAVRIGIETGPRLCDATSRQARFQHCSANLP